MIDDPPLLQIKKLFDLAGQEVLGAVHLPPSQRCTDSVSTEQSSDSPLHSTHLFTQ